MDLACKDLGFALGMGREFGVPLELAGLVEQTFIRARQQLGGGAWSTAVVRLLEEAPGRGAAGRGFPDAARLTSPRSGNVGNPEVQPARRSQSFRSESFQVEVLGPLVECVQDHGVKPDLGRDPPDPAQRIGEQPAADALALVTPVDAECHDVGGPRQWRPGVGSGHTGGGVSAPVMKWLCSA